MIMDTTLKGVLASLKQSNSAAATPNKDEEKPKEYQGVKMEMEECRFFLCLLKSSIINIKLWQIVFYFSHIL